MNFDFFMPTQLIFGEGKLSQISNYIKEDKIMIICDPIVRQLGITNKLSQYMADKILIIYTDIEPNPGLEIVDNAVKTALENNVEAIIGIGGGSSLDTAKAVSVITANGGSIREYVTNKRSIKVKRLPLILIPTTAGTGSECTAVGVFSDHENNRKFPLFSKELRADTAILDPELTCTAPPHVTAVTGIDAFTHAIESYWNIVDSPLTDTIAMTACDLVMKNLYKCYIDPLDKEARTNMSLAGMMGGFAFGQTKTTIIHSMSFPLADLYKVDHGTACAMTLIPVIRYVNSKAGDKMKKLVSFCGYRSFDDFIEDLANMLKEMKIPQKLSDIGAKKDDLSYIVDTTMNFQMTELLPGKISESELFDLLKKILN